MMNKKNILDLSKQKPNLGFGVNVSKIEKPTKKISYDIKPRIPVKKKIENIRDYDESRVNFTKDIYNIWNEKNSSEDFQKLPKKKSGKLISFLVFLILFAGAFSYIVYSNSIREITGEGVVLEMKSDDNFTSGSEAKFTIKISNKQNVKIENLELRLNYPKDFYYVSSDPEAKTLSMNVWKLEDLQPGRSTEIKLVGQIVGNIGDEVNLDAILSYEPANFNSALESKYSKTLKIDKSMIDLAFDGPDEVGGNSRITYTFKYKNISNSDINNFRIRLEYPENFIPIETGGGAKAESNNSWLIQDLKKDSEASVYVTGIFDAETIASSTLKAFLEIKSLVVADTNPLITIENKEDWHLYKEISKDIKIKQSLVNVKLSINDELRDLPVNWGSDLNYQINYKNTSASPIENAILKATFNSDYVDLKALQDDYKGVLDEANKTLTWDKESIPSLAKINPGQEGRISFKLKTIPFKEELISKNDYSIISSVAFLYGKNSEEQIKNQIQSNNIIAKLNSIVDFSANSRYYDESAKVVGSGPIPPLVGEVTTYQVIWKLKSKTNSLKEVFVKAILPDDVDWSDGVVADGQDLSFNETTKQVIWSIDNLDKNKEVSVKFDVTVNPVKGNIGKPMILNNTILLSATDAYSNGKFSITKNPITTECLGDKKALGKGSVIDMK